MALKYIVQEINGIETPLVFPEYHKHSDVANEKWPVVSAGFVTIIVSAEDVVEAFVAGESMSLNVKSRPSDALLIEKLIKNKI